MFGYTLLYATPDFTGRHWYCRCLVVCTLIVLSLSYAVTNPVILINGGGSEVDPTLMDCSQQTPEYDSETGLTTYRCKPVLKDVVEKIYVADADYGDDVNNTITETMIVKTDLDDQDDVKYQVLRSKLSKKKRKNRKNRKSKNIRRSKNYHLYERMISDAPMKDKSMSKMAKNDVKSALVHSVGKFDIKNRCAPGEVYASELHICSPHTMKSKYSHNYDQPQSDAIIPNAKHNKNNKNKLLKVRKSDIENRCGLGELYISELDICLPHDYKRDYSNIYDQPQSDTLTPKSRDYNNNDNMLLKVGKFEGKSSCGDEEVYLSELDICIPHNNIANSDIYDRPQADSSTFIKSNHQNKSVKRQMKVGKFHGKSRCGTEEFYLSELDICVPHDNKVDESNNIYDHPQADALTLESYDPENDNKRTLIVSKFEGKSRCGSGEVYLSELDICLPHENKLVQFSIHNRPQADMPEDKSDEIDESEGF